MHFPTVHSKWSVLGMVLLAFVAVPIAEMAYQNRPGGFLLADDATPVFTHVIIDAEGPNVAGSRGIHVKSTGDFNGDGRLDLVVAGSLLGEPLIWYESPTWTKHTISTLGGWSTDAQAGDIDQDGDQDLVISSWYRADVGLEWFENTGHGLGWVHHVIGPPRAHDMELADFDLDGDLDIVTRDQEDIGNKLEVWRQETPDIWTHRTLNTGVPTGEGLTSGDIDRDGDADIVIGTIWYENSRDIIAGDWPAHIYTTTWTDPDVTAAVADINRDGRPDIVLVPSERAGDTHKIAWYEAPADPTVQEWPEHVIDAETETVMHSLKIADIDTDGDLDVVTAEMHQGSDPDEVRIYTNEGVGGTGADWTKHVIATTGSHALCLGDFDRDGDIDLFGCNWAETRAVDLWRNDLNRRLSLDQWTRHVIDDDRPGKAVFITVADLNGNGRQDIITGGSWYDHPNDATAPWPRHTIGAPLNNMAAVYDFDQDSDADILGTPYTCL